MLKNIIKNTTIYIVTACVGQAVMSLFWLALAWWLSPSEIGIYSLAMVVINFFSIACVFSLNSAIGRYYYSKESVPAVFTNAFVLFSGFTVLVLLIFVSSINLLLSFMPGLSGIMPRHILLFSSAIILSSAATICFAHYVTLKKSFIYAVLNFCQTVIFCLFSILLVKMGFGVVSLLYGLSASYLAIIIYFFVKEKDIFNLETLSQKTMRVLLSFASPLLFSSIFGMVSYYIAQIFLGKYANLSVLGVYSFFLFFALQVNGFQASFNRAWTPEIFSNIQNDGNSGQSKKNVEFMVFLFCFFYLLGLLLFSIMGKLSLFNMFLKPEYVSSLNILYVLLMAPVFSAIFTIVSPLIYHPGKSKYVIFSSIIITVLNFIVSAVLTRYFYINGAVISFLATSMLSTLLNLLIFRKISSIHKNIIIFTIFLILAMGLSCWALLSNSHFLLFLAIIIGAIIFSAWLGKIPARSKMILENYVFKKL